MARHPAPYGFGTAASTPWLPMPDDWAPLTVAAQRKDPDSTWSFYRDALRARRRVAHDGNEVEIVEGRSTVLHLRRGGLTVVCNCGSRPVRLPAGRSSSRAARSRAGCCRRTPPSGSAEGVGVR